MSYPKVDFKGFETEVSNARAILGRSETVFILYSPESGFIFRKDFSEEMEELVFDKKISMVGCYKKPLRSPYLVEDLEFEVMSSSDRHPPLPA